MDYLWMPDHGRRFNLDEMWNHFGYTILQILSFPIAFAFILLYGNLVLWQLLILYIYVRDVLGIRHTPFN